MPIVGGNRGYVLVAFALLLCLLLGFAGLGVDFGILYGSHTAAQKAADAAALAGAFTFITNPSAGDPVALATDRALNTAIQNQVLGETIQASEVAINVEYGARLVTVDVTHPVRLLFLKALLVGPSATVHAQAIAEAAHNATGSKCVKPWFLPNSLFAPAGVNACGACSNPTANLVVIPPNNINNTALINAIQGTQFTLKAGNPGGAIAPGQFYAIDIIDQNTGADIYRESIAGCPGEATFYCLGTYSTKTGNMQGPTIQGVEGGSNLSSWLLNTPSPDTWAGYAGKVAKFNLNGNGSIQVDTSCQLVVCPLWNVCTATLDCSDPNNPKFPSGTGAQLQVIGFALLFIEGTSGGDVLARILDVEACGAAPPGTTETGPFAVPLRLVRKN